MASRSRPASVVLDSVRRDLETGWPPGLTVLTGDDLFHLDRAQKTLLEGLLPEESPEYSLTVFGENKVAVTEVVNAARAIGMFTERRVVLVREISALDGEPEAVEQFAASPPSSAFLVVRAPALDRRRKLHKALVKCGKLLEFDAAGESDPRLLEDVRGIAAEAGIKLDRDTVNFLAESCAADLYRVSAEVLKIRAWLGEDNPAEVTLDCAREVAVGGGVIDSWQLADAVMQRDSRQASESARRLLDSGVDALQILGGLASRVRVMLQARAARDRGVSEREALSTLRLPWSAKQQLGRCLSRYTLDELRGFPALLLEADRTLKSRSIDPGCVIEALVETMTIRAVAPGGARR